MACIKFYWGIALFLIATFVAQPGLAQNWYNKQKAQEYFKLGAAFFKSGEYEKAVEYMTKANELDPNPILNYNIGRCFQKLGKWEKCIAYYKRYIASNPSQEMIDKSKVFLKFCQDKYEESAGYVIMFNSTPMGANIIIDNATVGQTPRAIKVKKGIHSLSLGLEGYETLTVNIEVTETSGRTLSFSLTPKRMTQCPEGTKRVGNKCVDVGTTKKGPWYRTPWFLVTASLGLALITSGIICGAMAWQHEKDANNMPNTESSSAYNNMIDKANKEALAANILYGIGGASLVASIIVFFLVKPKKAEPKDESSITPIFLRNGGMISYKFSF